MGSVGEIDHRVLRQLFNHLLKLGYKPELLLLISFSWHGCYLLVDKVEFG